MFICFAIYLNCHIYRTVPQTLKYTIISKLLVFYILINNTKVGRYKNMTSARYKEREVKLKTLEDVYLHINIVPAS